MSQSLSRRLVPALAAAIMLLALTVPGVAFAASASAHAATQHQQISSSASTGAQSEGTFSVPLTCFRDANGIVTCAYPGGPVSSDVSTGASSGGNFTVPLTVSDRPTESSSAPIRGSLNPLRDAEVSCLMSRYSHYLRHKH